MSEFSREFKLALWISWLIATGITTGCALMPYVFSETQIARLVPRCESMTKLGRPCFFCGMTTGFLDIAHGKFHEAEHANRGALPLYGGFLGNGILAAGILTKGRPRC